MNQFDSPLKTIENDIKNIKHYDEHFANVKEYKKNYFHETVDKYFQETNLNKPMDMVYVNTYTLTPTFYNKYIRFAFPNFQSNKIVFKNLRLMDNKLNNLIDQCTFDVAGSHIDIIYGKVFDLLRYIYGITNESVLPFSFCRNNDYCPNMDNGSVVIQLNQNIVPFDFNLQVDVFEVNEPTNINNLLIQLQFSGEEDICSGHCKYKINFNNQVCFLVMESDATIDRFKLQIDGWDFDNYNMENMIKYKNYYILPLTPS